MSKPLIATTQQTIEAILDRSHRQDVPIRRSFVRVQDAIPRPPLAEMVHHHDERALDLYLLILAQASGGRYDVTHPAAVWARALDLQGASGPAAVSKTLARLVGYHLIRRDRSGRRARLTLLREDGSGQQYCHPAQAKEPYLRLPHAYWIRGWHQQLTLPAKAALLIAHSLPVDFYLPLESAPKQFALSADTLGDGVRELVRFNLLSKRQVSKVAPLTALGYQTEYRYRLLAPLERRSGQRRSPAVASSPVTGTT